LTRTAGLGALVAAALVAAVALAGPGTRTRAPSAVPTGFRHATHAAALANAGSDAPSCTACHAAGPSGLLETPGHDDCFGACHGAAPPRARRGKPYVDAQSSPARRAVCATCHSPAALDALAAGRPASLRPPTTTGPDRPSEFALALSHRTHNAGSPQCRSCHAPPGERLPARLAAPHARCARCHDGSPPPAMTACEGCHTPAAAEAPPSPAGGPLAQSIEFSHARHLARGADCVPCHAATAAAESAAPPPPDKSSCAGCHDGGTAFSTATTRCRECHVAPADPPDRPPLPRTAYSHARHALLGVGDPCSQCHELDKRGRPRPAARDHQACAQPACHASDFAALSPITCGSCHIGTAPWRPLHAEPPPTVEPAFEISFSHADHIGRGRPATDRNCDDCHGSDRNSHQLCGDDACHGGEGGRSLDDCGTCHRDAARDAPTRPWSVAARFSHDAHRVDSSGAPLPCDQCHGDVAAAAPTPPPKRTCAPCHDGVGAFKMTGHGCARCHGPPGAPAP